MDHSAKEVPKKSHLTRNVAVIAVVFIVVIAGVFFAYNEGLFGLSLFLKKSSPLSIVVSSITDDQPDASHGNTIYVYNLTITDNSQSKQYSISPVDFELVTNASSVYNSETLFYWGDANELSSVTISPGLNTKGNVAFEFPSDQTPAYITYNITGSIDKIANLPPVSSWVSEISLNGNVTVNGVANLTASVAVDESIFGGEYVTGQAIPIEITIANDEFTNVTVTSISVTSSGFKILNESLSVPFNIHYAIFLPWYKYVYMNVTAPSYCFQGAITFSINATT